ncbi:hypothetical protein WJX73_008653 [Symbiochloris irregularis]|uniref:F-box domain-containing protein n=1 Tax=Symbiochloris irregularis TaxID=706552 RepID=A0AAW1PHG8_9CHLO
MQHSDSKDLPFDVLRQVMSFLTFTQRPTLRQVCRFWRDTIDADIFTLAPARLETASLNRWRALKVLNLSRVDTCQEAAWTALPHILRDRTLNMLVLPSKLECVWPAGTLEELGSFSVQHLSAGQAVTWWPQLLGGLQGPTTLSIQGVDFPAPPVFCQRWCLMGRLSCLILKDCSGIRGATWDVFASLGLEQLHLLNHDGMKTACTFEGISQTTTLRHLVFSQHGKYAGDRLEREHFECLSQLQLTHLSLRNTPLCSDWAWSGLSALTGLEALDVSGSTINSSGLQHLTQLQCLRELNVASTHLTLPADLDTILGSHPQLTYLNCSQCRGTMTAASTMFQEYEQHRGSFLNPLI